MNSIIIIQARMGSKRFPGKSLFPFQGKPSLIYLIESVKQVFNSQAIFVATSSFSEDNPIEEICLKMGLRVFRGDNDNVASRFFGILKSVSTDCFVRLSGDSPMLDYRTIVSALRLFEASELDLVSTVPTASCPSGLNVEAVSSGAFLREYEKFHNFSHLEHVTKYFYENSDRFKIIPLDCGIKNPEQFKFSFDDALDRERLEKMFATFDRPHYCYTMYEKCEIFKKLFLNPVC